MQRISLSKNIDPLNDLIEHLIFLPDLERFTGPLVDDLVQLADYPHIRADDRFRNEKGHGPHQEEYEEDYRQEPNDEHFKMAEAEIIDNRGLVKILVIECEQGDQTAEKTGDQGRIDKTFLIFVGCKNISFKLISHVAPPRY